jgi:MarR-like DNA-binding transcriptional regulator SgrR of sgrS sRNA
MNIHNSLLTLDQDLKPVPDLAKKWEVSPDGLIYTFRLHDGMKFHDGTDMDAEAVKWNFEHMMEPKTKSAVRVFYTDVKAVEVVGQQTVRFVLNEPNYMLPPIVGGYRYGFVVSSPTAFKTTSEQEYRMKPVGTGPFKFLEHVPNDRLVLVRNERYFKKDLPYLDKVVFKVLTDPMTQVSGLRADVFGENRGDGRSRRTFRAASTPLHTSSAVSHSVCQAWHGEGAHTPQRSWTHCAGESGGVVRVGDTVDVGTCAGLCGAWQRGFGALAPGGT